MKSLSVCALLVVVFCLSSPLSFAAATIQGVTSAPLDAGGVFDVGNPGIQYSLGTGTLLLDSQYDVRDMFGGTFGTVSSEQGNVIFADNQPAGTVETVNVIPAKVTEV